MTLFADIYGFCRNIMKELTKVLIIAAIVPNIIFFTFYLLAICNDDGGQTLSLRDWVGIILIFALPLVMLITIALTFYKRFKILHFVLRIIAVILNAYLLIPLIWNRHEILDDLPLDVYLMYFAFAVANLVVIALTFIKEKEKIENS